MDYKIPTQNSMYSSVETVYSTSNINGGSLEYNAGDTLNLKFDA